MRSSDILPCAEDGFTPDISLRASQVEAQPFRVPMTSQYATSALIDVVLILSGCNGRVGLWTMPSQF